MLDRICKVLLIVLAIASYAIWLPGAPAASDASQSASGRTTTAAVIEAGRSPSGARP